MFYSKQQLLRSDRLDDSRRIQNRACTKQTFKRNNETNQKWQLETAFNSEKNIFKQQTEALTMYTGIIFTGVDPFIPPKLRQMVLAKALETQPGNNASEASVRMIPWWPGITQEVQFCVVNVTTANKQAYPGKKSLYRGRSRRLWTAPHFLGFC